MTEGGILSSGVREVLSVQGTFEQRAGRSKEMSRREMWRKRVPGRRNSRSEGSETGLCAECLRRRIGDSVPGGTRVRKGGWGCGGGRSFGCWQRL